MVETHTRTCTHTHTNLIVGTRVGVDTLSSERTLDGNKTRRDKDYRWTLRPKGRTKVRHESFRCSGVPYEVLKIATKSGGVEP